MDGWKVADLHFLMTVRSGGRGYTIREEERSKYKYSEGGCWTELLCLRDIFE